MSATHRLLRFGVFELNLDTEELRKSGVLVKLSPQPFKLLALIAGRSGLLVTREEIQKELWGEDTFVDFEQGMNHCIKQIRGVLNDNANAPLYVETVPRRGYRFLAPVTSKTVAAPARVQESHSEPLGQVAIPVSSIATGGAVAAAQVGIDVPAFTSPHTGASFSVRAAEPAVAAGAPAAVTPTAWSNRRNLLLAVGALVVIAVIAYAVINSVRVTVEPRPRSIAILPFEGSGQDTAFALGLSESIAAKLLQAHNRRSFEMISPREARDVGVTTAADARKRLKADYVLEGVVEKSGAQVRLTCSLVDARTLRTVEARTVSGDSADLFALQDKVIAETLAMIPGAGATPPKVVASTAQPPGYESYLRGRGYLQDYQRQENVENAIADFIHALDLEPAYAPAHAGLGQAYWIGYDSFQKGKEWLEQSQAECRRALELDTKLAEAHACMGNYYNAVGQYRTAAQEFHSSVELDSGNLTAWRGLGRAYDRLNDTAEAESAYQKATEVSPHYWAPFNWLAVFYYRHGRYPDAARMYRAALDRAPDNQRLYNNLAGLYIETGDYDKAIDLLQASPQTSNASPADNHLLSATYSNLGVAYFYKHNFDQAEDNFRKSTSLEEGNYEYWGNLGDALYWNPRHRADSPAAYQKARQLVQARLEVNPTDGAAEAYLAFYLAMLNQRDAASVQLQRALRAAPGDPDVLFRAGLVHNGWGEANSALAYLKEAVDHGYSPTIVRDSPEFGNLRSDARFVALVYKK